MGTQTQLYSLITAPKIVTWAFCTSDSFFQTQEKLPVGFCFEHSGTLTGFTEEPKPPLTFAWLHGCQHCLGINIYAFLLWRKLIVEKNSHWSKSCQTFIVWYIFSQLERLNLQAYFHAVVVICEKTSCVIEKQQTECIIEHYYFCPLVCLYLCLLQVVLWIFHKDSSKWRNGFPINLGQRRTHYITHENLALVPIKWQLITFFNTPFFDNIYFPW